MIRLVFAPQRIQTRSAEGGRSGGIPRSGIQPRQGRPVKKRGSQANGGTVRLTLSLIREEVAARTLFEAERPKFLMFERGNLRFPRAPGHFFTAVIFLFRESLRSSGSFLDRAKNERSLRKRRINSLAAVRLVEEESVVR
jgi:hypothetical protein